ncbi:MAG: hypothetical protein ACK55I_48870, partial [bacterium]
MLLDGVHPQIEDQRGRLVVIEEAVAALEVRLPVANANGTQIGLVVVIHNLACRRFVGRPVRQVIHTVDVKVISLAKLMDNIVRPRRGGQRGEEVEMFLDPILHYHFR